MALDTKQKRASVIGVARPWYRNSVPDGTMGLPKRWSIGNAYAQDVTVSFNTEGNHTVTVQDAYTEVLI